jgi:hypothetical protein
MKRPTYLTLLDHKPLKMVGLAPLPPAPVRKMHVHRAPMVASANCDAATSAGRDATAILVVAFVFWAVYFLMNHLGA